MHLGYSLTRPITLFARALRNWHAFLYFPVHTYCAFVTLLPTGTRMCLGKNLSQWMIFMMLTAVFQRFSIKLSGDVGPDVFGLIRFPGDFKLVFTERKQAWLFCQLCKKELWYLKSVWTVCYDFEACPLKYIFVIVVWHDVSLHCQLSLCDQMPVHTRCFLDSVRR